MEKRLKVENSELPKTSSQYNSTSTDSEVSPLYLNFNPTDNSYESETQVSASLSNPSSTPSQNVSDKSLSTDESECDEIDKMIKLLGLKTMNDEMSCVNSYNCEDSFYEKIVGVKGPKCRKEVKRLNGWIDFFCNGESDKRKEPFKLAHLLLGKASLLFGDGDDDDSELEFPSTLSEFLKIDPPLQI